MDMLVLLQETTMRKLLKSIVAQMVIINSLMSRWYAQEASPPPPPPPPPTELTVCKTCSTMATWLEKYVEVMTKLIALLDQEPQFLSDGIRIPAPWQMYIRRVFTENVLTASIVPAKEALVASLKSIPDVFDAFSYLFSSKAIMRDSVIFDEIEREIQKKAIAMSVARSYYRPIAKGKLDQIDALLKQLGYIKLWKSTTNAERYNFQVTWKHNGAMLGKFYLINEIYRDLYANRFYTEYFADIGSLEYVSTSNPKDQFQPLLENESTVQVVQLLLNFVNDRWYRGVDNGRKSAAENTFKIDYLQFVLHVRSIETEYRCARGKKNVCDGWPEVRRTWWETMQSNWAIGVALSKNTFLDAMARLKGELWWSASSDEKAAAQQRKQALLRSQWWPRAQEFDYNAKWTKINKENTTQGNMLSLPPMMKTVLELVLRKSRLWQTLDNNSVASNVEERVTPSSNVEEWVWTRLLQEQYTTTSQRSDYLTKIINEYSKSTMIQPLLQADVPLILSANTRKNAEEMVLSMQTTLFSVMELQAELQLDAITTDATQVTHLFPQLSMYVYKWSQIIGNKTSDASIVKYLWIVCEEQCSTLRNKKCYYYKN
jgi:hypothetical protein